MADNSTHRSLARALDVLELCSASETGYTLSQLCHRLNVPKSSLFPLVHTLKTRGYLILEPNTQRYRIGSIAYQVGNTYLEGDNVMREIQQIIKHVVDVCGETCHLGCLKGGDVFYLKKIESPQQFQMLSTVGRSLPAYATALGKALLADHTLAMLKALYYDGLTPLTRDELSRTFSSKLK